MSSRRLPHEALAELAVKKDHKQPQPEVQHGEQIESDQSSLLNNRDNDEDKDKGLSGERREPERKMSTQSIFHKVPLEIAPGNDPEQSKDKVKPVEVDKNQLSRDGDKDEDEDGDEDQYMTIDLSKLTELRCPICLGIIRKTQALMECMHRFCRVCIEKSLRLGTNECPVCHTHCAGIQSLRHDANFDTLISLLYPDIDKHEEKEELALHEDERIHNKEESTIHADGTSDRNIPELNLEIVSSANSVQNNSRASDENARSIRLSRFIDHLRNSDVTDDDMEIPLVLVSLDEQKIPSLQEPYLYCKRTCSVKILCKYVALKAEVLDDQIELSLVEESQTNVVKGEIIVDPGKDKLRALRAEETLAELYTWSVTNCGHLILAYKMK